MPGSVIDVRVKVGDHVEKGATLVVLSGMIIFFDRKLINKNFFIAMKMEMVVQSPRAGTIKTLSISSGMKLEGEDLILTFE